jgi:AcrR family transcriptional regulator
MATQKSRSYQSPTRRRQADETRRRIADAARQLLVTHGYAGMTIDAIATEAGVAAQTVYSVFGSKTGILKELLDQARFGPDVAGLIQQAMSTPEPSDRLRFVSRIACTIYASENTMFELLRGAGVVAPELASLEKDQECQRYESQEPVVTYLLQEGRLREGLDLKTARDILWTLTGRSNYRMMVIDRGWTIEQYQTWLAETLITSLLR